MPEHLEASKSIAAVGEFENPSAFKFPIIRYEKGPVNLLLEVTCGLSVKPLTNQYPAIAGAEATTLTT
jgi:hypothetical protein